MRQVIVVGGGASGMMAAVGAAREGARVTLLEKNEKTGKKIYITGKGRCNLTNACEKSAFFDQMISNGKFLYSAFEKMDNHSVMDFFEKSGCRLKQERGMRIFPVSDHSSDVIAALNRQMKKEGVEVCLHTRAAEVLTERYNENGREPDLIGEAVREKKSVRGVRLSDGRILEADAVILATGGKSYESTGSAGEGYMFAQRLGHTLKEMRPALVPFCVKESWCMDLQGLSLKNVSLVMTKDKKKIYEGFGEMLFTHFGVSGPLILSASSYYAKKYYGMQVKLSIDLKPALTPEQLDQRILRDFEENRNRQFKNALDHLLPARMTGIIVTLSGIDPARKVNEITRTERSRLAACIKNLTLTVTGTRGFSEAIVTQGGVNVKEVNPSTMESKLVRGLYFAGEVLDVDGLTGGFNLQIAWSTGYLAGICAAQEAGQARNKLCAEERRKKK